MAAGTSIASPAPLLATPSSAEYQAPGTETDLITGLNARGVTVEDAGSLAQPFFGAARTSRLLLTGNGLPANAEIQVYAYENPQALAADIGQITPDGNFRTVMIEWIAPPHFFCSDQLMVIYLGDSQAVLELLMSVMGPQFAGR